MVLELQEKLSEKNKNLPVDNADFARKTAMSKKKQECPLEPDSKTTTATAKSPEKAIENDDFMDHQSASSSESEFQIHKSQFRKKNSLAKEDETKSGNENLSPKKQTTKQVAVVAKSIRKREIKIKKPYSPVTETVKSKKKSGKNTDKNSHSVYHIL